jgi:ABC-2 type transport system ATP-binding protein
MPALEVRGVTKSYGRGREALRGVDLAIEPGAAFGLIGPNGAGKTTLVKALLGVVHVTSGEVRVFGVSPEEPAVRRRIGYLPERLHFPAGVTARGFLRSVARLRSLAAPEPEIERQLGRVGLADDAPRTVSGFSKGMKQRLGLAAALLGAPELLVLDEPTDGVDPLGRADVRRILGEERQRGATILLNSHLLSETERVCDRIGILVGGRLVRHDTLDALCGSRTSWRARFESPVDGLASLGFTAVAGEPDVWRIDSPDAAALSSSLARARDLGALVVELRRDWRELEEILAEAVRS